MSNSTTAPIATAYDELITIVRDAGLLRGTAAILDWDQQVMMPPGGREYRSQQIAQIARLHHERMTDPRIGQLLDACVDLGSDPLSPEAVNVRELRRDYDRRTRLPASLVEEEAKLASLGHHIWAEARKNDDFALFRPTLEKIVELLRRKAACYGWADDGEAWDALAEDYEPGCTAVMVESVFTPLRERLQALLGELMGSSTRPSGAFNGRPFDVDAQGRFVRFVSAKLGFDYERGRLDTSAHPFCQGSHPGDVRLTTRFRDHNVNDALGSTMHEAGHGMYEQGLPQDYIGTPMGQAVSLGIHESQSRMWENQVGRSLAFWKWCHPVLRDHFGAALDGCSLDEAYGAANIVEPGFIRIEADEATYNMHIIVRFEMERALLRGDLEVADVPTAWNDGYKHNLGIDVPNDTVGCLQDVHWSSTSMGYFPTYTLGTLYGAQIFEKACDEIPDLETRFERGAFDDLRVWLNERVHAHGRRYRPEQLCEAVTGKPLTADPLMRHLERKLRPLYGV